MAFFRNNEFQLIKEFQKWNMKDVQETAFVFDAKGEKHVKAPNVKA